MATEVADLYVSLRATSGNFIKGMTEAQLSARKTDSSITSLGNNKALAAIPLAAVGAGAAATKMAADWQSSMHRLVNAAGESRANLAMVSTGLLKLAQDTGTSTQQIAAGMYMVESAGYHGAAGLLVMKAAAQGARIEGADLGTVSNALTTAMKDIHAPASQAATVMSQMVAAVGQGKMTMNDLAGALHSVLPNATALGISFPQVAGALATMTAQGVSADQGAQNLNHTIVKLAAPTAAMSAQMASYGLNAADLARKLGKNGLTGTMSTLVKAITDHMGPAGVTLRSAFNLSQAAAQNVQRMLTSLPASLQKAAQGFLNGSVNAAQFRKDFKALGAAGAGQGQQFMALAEKAHGFSTALKTGGQDSQTFIAALKGMLGDQTGLQVALHLTGGAAGDFANNVNTISKAAADSKGRVKDWADVTHTLKFQLDKARETIAVLAIKIGTALMPWVEKMLHAFMAVIKFFEAHKAAAIALGVVLGGILAVGFAAAAVAAWSFTAALLANPAVWIVVGIMALIAAIVLLATHWHQAWTWIKRIAGDVGHFLLGLWDHVAGAAKAVWHGITQGVTTAWDAVISFVKGIPGRILSGFSNAGHLLLQVGKDIIEGFWHGLEFIAMIPERLYQLVVSHGGLLGIGKALMSTLWHGLVTGAKAVWDWVKAIPGELLKLFNTATLWLHNAGKRVITGMWNGIVEAAKAVWDWAKALPGKLLNLFNTATLWLHNTGWDIITGMWNGIQAAASWVWGVISALPGQLLNFFTSLPGDMLNIGRDIVTGIWNGIAGAASWLWDKLESFASSIWGGIKKFLGIGSPSRVLADEVGQWIPKGIAAGIDEHAHTVHAAMTRLRQSMTANALGPVTLASLTNSVRGAQAGPGMTAALGGTDMGSGAIFPLGGSVTTVNNVVHLTVQGTVIAERDLARTIETQMAQLGLRRGVTYQPARR